MFTWLVHWLLFLILLFLCNSSAAGGSKGKTSTLLLTLQTAAVWTGLAIRCPFPSEISVEHELGILITVMRYFYLLKSVIRASDSLPYPHLLRFTQFALRTDKPPLRMFQQCTKGVSFHFSFADIPEASGRVFDWNPCTPFTTDVSGCNNVTVS